MDSNLITTLRQPLQKYINYIGIHKYSSMNFIGTRLRANRAINYSLRVSLSKLWLCADRSGALDHNNFSALTKPLRREGGDDWRGVSQGTYDYLPI